MNKPFPLVPLGEVLTRSDEIIAVEAEKTYREVTVRLWGKGVTQRRVVSGIELKGAKRFVAKVGQFIVSRIDARNGAFGLVPESLDGAIVTNDFPLFRVELSRLLPAYLNWLSKTEDFVNLCRAASEGTTNRVRLQEIRFFKMKIPLPPLAEQRRIVACIEGLAAKIEEAKGLRKQAVEEVEALVKSAVSKLLKNRYDFLDLQSLVKNEKHAFKRGPFGSSLRKEFFVPRGVKVYEQKNVIRNDFQIGNYFIDEQKFEQLKGFQVEPSDVLITCSGTIGKVAVVPKDAQKGIINQALLKLTLDNNKILNEFFLIIFQSPATMEEINKLTPGSAMKNVASMKHLKKILFPLPPLDKQRRIVAYLDALQSKVDTLKRLQEETQKELDALLPSILDKAFKGELV
jgi:type I restriction enzyme S subunit